MTDSMQNVVAKKCIQGKDQARIYPSTIQGDSAPSLVPFDLFPYIQVLVSTSMLNVSYLRTSFERCI